MFWFMYIQQLTITDGMFDSYIFTVGWSGGDIYQLSRWARNSSAVWRKPWRIWRQELIVFVAAATCPIYPLVNIQKAIENGHLVRWSSHWKWWCSIVMLVYQGKWSILMAFFSDDCGSVIFQPPCLGGTQPSHGPERDIYIICMYSLPYLSSYICFHVTAAGPPAYQLTRFQLQTCTLDLGFQEDHGWFIHLSHTVWFKTPLSQNWMMGKFTGNPYIWC